MNIKIRKKFSNILFQDLKPGDAFISTDNDSLIYDRGVFLKVEDCNNGKYDNRNAVCLKNGELWFICNDESVAKFTRSLKVPYSAFERGKIDE